MVLNKLVQARDVAASLLEQYDGEADPGGMSFATFKLAVVVKDAVEAIELLYDKIQAQDGLIVELQQAIGAEYERQRDAAKPWAQATTDVNNLSFVLGQVAATVTNHNKAIEQLQQLIVLLSGKGKAR